MATKVVGKSTNTKTTEKLDVKQEISFCNCPVCLTKDHIFYKVDQLKNITCICGRCGTFADAGKSQDEAKANWNTKYSSVINGQKVFNTIYDPVRKQYCEFISDFLKDGAYQLIESQITYQNKQFIVTHKMLLYQTTSQMLLDTVVNYGKEIDFRPYITIFGFENVFKLKFFKSNKKDILVLLYQYYASKDEETNEIQEKIIFYLIKVTI